jgi:hypothetical protein
MKKYIDWMGDMLVKARGRSGVVKYAFRRGLLALPLLVFAVVVSVLLFTAMPFAWALDKIMEWMENE